MAEVKKLDEQEELDFHLLLSLMPPLHNEPDFALLPELFAILGHEKLIELCKYAGGELLVVPTVKQLADSIEALQWFYNIYIKKTGKYSDVPPEIVGLLDVIRKVYKC